MFSAIATLWATKIKNGEKSLEDVPSKLLEQVKDILATEETIENNN